MIPHKTKEGSSCSCEFEDFCWCTAAIDKVKRMVIPDALKVLRLQAGHKYYLLGRLSYEVGWNQLDAIWELEKKRKERSQLAYEKKISNVIAPHFIFWPRHCLVIVPRGLEFELTCMHLRLESVVVLYLYDVEIIYIIKVAG